MSRVSAVLVTIRNLTISDVAAVIVAVAVIIWPAITGHNAYIYPDLAATIHCVTFTHFHPSFHRPYTMRRKVFSRLVYLRLSYREWPVEFYHKP